MNRRQALILTRLQTGAYAEVKELAAALNVDTSTIRRDLQLLTRSGRVERVHGGVRLRPDSARPSPALHYSSDRASLAIACGARRLLSGEETLALGGGHVTDQLLPMLLDLPRLTVVTTSLTVATFLTGHEHIEVHMPGGHIRPGSGELVGEETVLALDRRRADWCFIEVDGVHPFAGLTTTHPWQVATRRALLACSQRQVVMAPSATFGVRAVGFIADAASTDLVITDEQLPDHDLPAFGGRVVRSAVDASQDWHLDTDSYTL